MRFLIAPTLLCLSWAGCERSARDQTSDVTLYPDKRSIGASVPKDCYMYASGRPPPEWSTCGLGIAAPERREHVEIRASDARNQAVQVEVTFKGGFDSRIASLSFQHLSKVDRVESNGPYKDWTLEGETFVLRAPKTAMTIRFLAWPHTH